MTDLWALTIGNFDGVHSGHRQLISRVVLAAKKLQGRAKVYTFHPHPAAVLNPEKAPLRLFDLADQSEQFRALGVDEIAVIEFTPAFSQTSPQKFFQDYILKEPGARVLWVGHDFQFGQGRSGNYQVLSKMCLEAGIEFHDLPPVQVAGQLVSSSAIREALKQGDLAKAELLLGRRYSFRGDVVAGARRGRLIGFPTANLGLRPEMRGQLPIKQGVYAGRVYRQQEVYSAVLNLGRNPTFNSSSAEQDLKIEVHLFDFNQEIYGESLRVELIEFLRNEKKFSGLEELKQQIAVDAAQARSVLGKAGQK